MREYKICRTRTTSIADLQRFYRFLLKALILLEESINPFSENLPSKLLQPLTLFV